MADEDRLLEKIGKLIEPIRAQLYEQGANIIRLVQGQKRTEKRLDKLDQDATIIKSVQQEQGEKLDELLAEAARTRTTVEILENKIDETKTEVDEIKKRQRPQKAD